MSELALQRIREAKAKHLIELDLSDSELIQLPDELFELIWLENLFLGRTQISDLSPLAQLKNLNVLGLNNTEISDLTPLATLTNLKTLFIHNIFLFNEVLFKRTEPNKLAELTNLTNLTALILSENGIKDVTPLTALTNLTTLILNNNWISDVTPLTALTNLTALTLNNNQISDVTPLTALTNLTTLTLNNNQISDVTPLATLTNLTKLTLNNNEISDVTPLTVLTNLTKLTLDNTKISDITPLAALTNLTELTLDNTRIKDVTPLVVLKNLTKLTLNNTRISDVTPLTALTNLTELTLDNTRINDVTPLAVLKNLTKLTLDNTRISDVTPLTVLINLTMLYLDNIRISDVTPLAPLINLKELTLNNNEISDVTVLAALTKLTTLFLNNNEISDVTPLGVLKNLTELSIDNNEISDVTPLGALANLTKLTLNDNEISDVTVLAALTKLTTLFLNGNQISDIKPLLVLIEKNITINVNDHYVSDYGIFVGDNPLKRPPLEIVEQGNEAVLTYFRNLEEQGEGKLNEAKLIIVGEPEAGKTSLMKKLLDPTYVIPQLETSTIGIQMHEGWQFPHPDGSNTTFSANIWDFGGQEIQYMTHQFFLTAGAIYVLVSANDRKETTANFPYWFKAIHLFGEENGVYSPVLVVQNDKNGQFIQQFDRNHYAKRYPKLPISTRIVNLSKDDANLQALRANIQDLLTQLPHVNDVRPARWNDIRTTLRECAKKQHHINFAEYAAICQQHAVKDEASQRLLSSYLHRSGSLLHFVDDTTLRDFIILNPQWAVDAVYSVLNDNRIAQAGGYFTLETLENIWRDEYDPIERIKLLNLMKKDSFEICYAVEGKPNTYLAPQLLTDKHPSYEWNDTDTLKFRFQYKFMPEGIITRLIVRLNHLIAKGQEYDLVWRKGMVLERNGCRAQIQEEENRDGLKVIDIAITGKPSERKYLLRTIRDEVEELHHKWFRNIAVEQMIPCNCEVCAKTAEPSYFSFDELQQYLDENELYIKCRNGRLKDVCVQPLLEGVFEPNEIQQLPHRRDGMTVNNNISNYYGSTHNEGDGQFATNSKDVTMNQVIDKSVTTITADQRQIISSVLDEMLEHKLPKDITKAVVKMQDVVEADAEQPTEKTQSLLSRFIGGVKQIAGFTDDASKIGEFVAKHQDDIGAVLTSIQSSL